MIVKPLFHSTNKPNFIDEMKSLYEKYKYHTVFLSSSEEIKAEINEGIEHLNLVILSNNLDIYIFFISPAGGESCDPHILYAAGSPSSYSKSLGYFFGYEPIGVTLSSCLIISTTSL